MLSEHAGEHEVIQESRSVNEAGEVTVNRSIHSVRRWPAHKIKDIPKHHGLAFFYGRSQPVPIYMKPYYKIPEAMAVARPDPYPHPQFLKLTLKQERRCLCVGSAKKSRLAS